MKDWERFEEYLYGLDLEGIKEFNHTAVVEDMGVSGAKATLHIQNYLGAQSRRNSRTLYVLRRVTGTRTSKAIWHVGERAADARGVGAQIASDMKCRIDRYTAPALQRIAEKNPRALPAAEAVAKGIEAGVELMAALMDGD